MLAGLAALLAGAPGAIAGPPTPAQVAALGELEKEANAYETAARDYRGAITRIVEHHYQDRRRRVLASLDAEIAVEKKGLRDAREEAIRRLEAFVASHSGKNAHPESTPDAMFRLAALYEERGRDDTESNEALAAALRPAIALYRRVIDEFPGYREMAGIHYYLGHAYNDAGRAGEAQQVWRSLVCHNHYPRAAGPQALPQDHDAAYWAAWEARRRAPATPAKKGAAAGDEATFQSPFPDDCQPIPQRALAGAEPRYLAEVWWLIGDHYFNEADPAAGPYAYNRAEAAYRQSVRFKKPPVHGVARYKLAWTHFKQQRYEASVRGFVDLLRYADQEEKATGDAGGDFRAEACTYIAGSLTYGDFTGPAVAEPFAPRSDVLDVETDPRAAERKMHVAIDRLQDARLIPQGEKWTVEIYRALAQEFRDLGQFHNAIEVGELILARWPLHRDAPVVQSDVADHFEKLAARERDGTTLRAETAAKALAARSRLSAYVGTTPWVEANKNDPDALRTADRLARGGLRRAAADHTNAGSALMQEAGGLRDEAARARVLERALGEYRLAAQGWTDFASLDEDPRDAYERRFWLADAHHSVVVIEVALGRVPATAEVEAAKRAATAVRDSNDDDRYLPQAAHMIVDVAQQVLDAQHDLYRRTRGAAGIEPRKSVKTAGSGAGEKVVRDELPREVSEAIAARDEYVRRVPAARDVTRIAPRLAYQAGEMEFLYGRFDEAKKRLSPLYKEQCKQSEYGLKAWQRLVAMAGLERDTRETRALSEAALAKSCATGRDEAMLEERIARGMMGVSYYEDARAAFASAQKMGDGPARAARWREAATLYRAALEKAPAVDDAPEAAINGAHAYKQVGDHAQAIELYDLLLREYGSDAALARLEKGDAGADPPLSPDAAKYAARVAHVQHAYAALSEAHARLFDFRRAASSYEALAANARFEPAARRKAARDAAVLHASLGDRERLAASRATLLALSPSAEQRAEIDFVAATAELKAWDEHGPDEGSNRVERLRATAAMDAFHAANKGNAAAAAFVVRAAYESARLRRAGRDPAASAWCKNTVAAFERLRDASPVASGRSRALGSAEADLGAECAYRLADEKIKAELEPKAGHHQYRGVIDQVMRAYEADLKRAEKAFDELQAIIGGFESRTWSAAARARQGSLYDACRTGLFHARAPELKLYTAREEQLLAMAANGTPALQELADSIRQKRTEDWRAARGKLLAEADRPMVKRYVEAVIWGRAWKVKGPAIDRAVERLAALAPLLGDATIREYSSGVVDPATKQPLVYKDGMFVAGRPGRVVAPGSEAIPAPLPAAP